MALDYSRWDDLECSDDEDEAAAGSRPTVTRLDAPSSVTFGGGGKPRAVGAQSGSARVAPTSTHRRTADMSKNGSRTRLTGGRRQRLRSRFAPRGQHCESA